MTNAPRKRFKELVAISIASAALFVLFASEGAERYRTMLDAEAHEWAGAARTPVADWLFGAITYLGWTPVLAIASAVAALILLRRSARLVFPAVLSPVVAMLVTDWVKGHFTRIRPIGIDMAGRSYSFPSGHSAGATAVALTLTYIFVRERMIGKVHFVWALALALSVGVSRWYLGQHFASDVVGGWVAGVGIASSCCLIYELLATRPAPSG